MDKHKIISNVEFHKRNNTRMLLLIKLVDDKRINVEIAKKKSSYNMKNFNNEFLNINIPNRAHIHKTTILNIY